MLPCLGVVMLPSGGHHHGGKAWRSRLPGALGVRQLVLWAPEPGNVPGNVRHFGWLRRAPFWCGNRWCRLLGLKPRAATPRTCATMRTCLWHHFKVYGAISKSQSPHPPKSGCGIQSCSRSTKQNYLTCLFMSGQLTYRPHFVTRNTFEQYHNLIP